MKKNILIIAVFGLFALFAGVFISQHNLLQKPRDLSQFHGTYLEKARSLTQFNLMGTDKKPFNNDSLKGQWTFVFFGFTNCGYLCPTTMAQLGKMYKILEAKNVKNLPKIVMISIDPDRDNLDKLEHYVKAFHPNFYGARGDESSVKSITDEMGIAFEKIVNKNSNPENYDVQHSGTILLINPQGELNAFFTLPHHAGLMAKDYLKLIS